jgi:hypothetical protein
MLLTKLPRNIYAKKSSASPSSWKTTRSYPKPREPIVCFAGRNPDEIRESYTKEGKETAGGMEDWEEMDREDLRELR